MKVLDCVGGLGGTGTTMHQIVEVVQEKRQDDVEEQGKVRGR